MPGDELHAQSSRNFLGQHRFAGARLALNQQRLPSVSAALTATRKSSVAMYFSVPSNFVDMIFPLILAVNFTRRRLPAPSGYIREPTRARH